MAGLPELLEHLRKVADRHEGRGGELHGIVCGIEDECLRLGVLELTEDTSGDTLSVEVGRERG